METKEQKPIENIIEKPVESSAKNSTGCLYVGNNWKITGITIGWMGIILSIVIGSFAPLLWLYGGNILVIAVISNSGKKILTFN